VTCKRRIPDTGPDRTELIAFALTIRDDLFWIVQCLNWHNATHPQDADPARASELAKVIPRPYLDALVEAGCS